MTTAAPYQWDPKSPAATDVSRRDARLCPTCKKYFDASYERCPKDGATTVLNRQGSLVSGRYKVGRIISVGADGAQVWGAQQEGVDRRVALKILPPGREDATRRFERGAHIAANLNHPHINTVHDFGTTDDGALYLVSEFLRGATLSRFLRDMPLDRERALLAVEQLLHALEHCHSRGYIHRDVKPENVYVTSLNDDSFVVQLLDFSIARHVDEDAAQGKKLKNLKRRLTKREQFCGTPEYMAPEQVVGTSLDGRVDIHALGVMLFRMLTGKLPFTGEDRYEVFQTRVSEAPPTLAQACPDRTFSEELETFVATAMAKHAVDRFQTTREMREALHLARLAPTPPAPAKPKTLLGQTQQRIKRVEAPVAKVEPASAAPSTAAAPATAAEVSLAPAPKPLSAEAAIEAVAESLAAADLTAKDAMPSDTVRDARPPVPTIEVAAITDDMAKKVVIAMPSALDVAPTAMRSKQNRYGMRTTFLVGVAATGLILVLTNVL